MLSKKQHMGEFILPGTHKKHQNNDVLRNQKRRLSAAV